MINKAPLSKSLQGYGLLLLLGLHSTANAQWSGSFSLEDQYFPNPALYDEQHENTLSLAIEPEYYHSFSESDWSVTFKPFVRIDQHDEERTHADIRELFFLHASDDIEFRIGLNKVYWGVTESLHLADIINQDDFVDNISGESKLGQPMLNATWYLSDSTLDFFILPGFRERTFPGIEGRFRGSLAIDTEHAEYEHEDKERHIDTAIRWSGTVLDNIDIAVHHFSGTSREPTIEVRNIDNKTSLVPVYYQMQQFGVELQSTLEAWLLKSEIIHRTTEPEDYTATVTGFEYTIADIEDSDLEIGLIMEYLYDSRNQSSFQNDLFLGSRWSMNDEDSSTLLFGAIIDLERDTRSFSIEASRRVADDWTIAVEGRLLESIDKSEPQYSIRNDDFIHLTLKRYF